VHPERSWTYELGVRTQHDLDFGWLTAIEGQANYYHVDFHNRLFNVAPFNLFNPPPCTKGYEQVKKRDGMTPTEALDDVGMLPQERRDPRLLMEHFDEHRILGVLAEDPLDRNGERECARRTVLDAAVYLPKAPLAEERDVAVAPRRRAARARNAGGAQGLRGS